MMRIIRRLLEEAPFCACSLTASHCRCISVIIVLMCAVLLHHLLRFVGKDGALLELDVVYREDASAMLGFDVDALSGQDIAVVTDQECLVYMRRAT